MENTGQYPNAAGQPVPPAPNGLSGAPTDGVPPTQDQLNAAAQQAQLAGVPQEEYQALVDQVSSFGELAEALQSLISEQESDANEQAAAEYRARELYRELSVMSDSDVETIEDMVEALGPFVERMSAEAVEAAIQRERNDFAQWAQEEFIPLRNNFWAYKLVEQYQLPFSAVESLIYFNDWPTMQHMAQQYAQLGRGQGVQPQGQPQPFNQQQQPNPAAVATNQYLRDNGLGRLAGGAGAPLKHEPMKPMSRDSAEASSVVMELFGQPRRTG